MFTCTTKRIVCAAVDRALIPIAILRSPDAVAPVKVEPSAPPSARAETPEAEAPALVRCASDCNRIGIRCRWSGT